MNGSSQQRPPYINDAEGIAFFLFCNGVTARSKWRTAWRAFWTKGLLGAAGLAWSVGDLTSMFDDHPNGLELLLMAGLFICSCVLLYFSIDVELRAAKQYRGEKNAFIAARLAFFWDKPGEYPGGPQKMEQDRRLIQGVYRPDD